MGAIPAFPDSPLGRIDDTLEEQLEQKWNVWRRTETQDEALLHDETEAAIQQWKNVSDKSVGKVFKALPTRVDLVLSNTEFRFMLESFWGSNLTIIDQARKMTPGRQPLVCLCGAPITADGHHLQRCKHFFKGRRHDILNHTVSEMVRDAFPHEVQVKKEPLLIEFGGTALDPSSRGDVGVLDFDGVRHVIIHVTIRTPSLNWQDTSAFLSAAEREKEKRYYDWLASVRGSVAVV